MVSIVAAARKADQLIAAGSASPLNTRFMRLSSSAFSHLATAIVATVLPIGLVGVSACGEHNFSAAVYESLTVAGWLSSVNRMTC
jgi:hypothetical protein